MSQENQDFSKTTMWKKSLAAEKSRANSLSGRFTMLLLTAGELMALVAAIYFFTMG